MWSAPVTEKAEQATRGREQGRVAGLPLNDHQRRLAVIGSSQVQHRMMRVLAA
jgi:hypothetical protein